MEGVSEDVTDVVLALDPEFVRVSVVFCVGSDRGVATVTGIVDVPGNGEAEIITPPGATARPMSLQISSCAEERGLTE